MVPFFQPDDLVNAVMASVKAHATGAQQSDDITILAVTIGQSTTAVAR